MGMFDGFRLGGLGEGPLVNGEVIEMKERDEEGRIRRITDEARSSRH